MSDKRADLLSSLITLWFITGVKCKVQGSLLVLVQMDPLADWAKLSFYLIIGSLVLTGSNSPQVPIRLCSGRF